MTRHTCPRCGESAARRPENPAFPFCSARCRLIDLGKWLDESYRIPGAPAESDELPPPRGSSEDDEP